MTARSTSITLMEETCPHALTLREQGAPYFREQFHVGIVAHDVLHAMGERRNRDKVCEDLIAVGRTGHDSEGPIPAAAVSEGRQLAEDYERDHPLPQPSPTMMYEAGFGFGAGWKLAPYEAATWLETRIDRVSLDDEYDEDTGECVVAVVADYKSSWAADATELETIQRKIQTVAVWKALPSLGWQPDAIEAQVINLRTHAVHRRRFWLPDDVAQLEAWQRDVEIAVRAHDRRPRVPSPGGGCITCDYAAVCSHRHAALAVDVETPVQAARAYAAARVEAKRLEDVARGMAGDRRRIRLPDGSGVGYLPVSKSTVRPAALREMWERWSDGHELTDDLVVGFLQAAGMGVTQVRKMIKKSTTDREERRALEASWITSATAARWSFVPPGTLLEEEG